MAGSESTWSPPGLASRTGEGRVVVGVDGSPGGHMALRYAAAVAANRDWTLHIVHTWHVHYAVAPYVVDFTDVESAAEQVAAETVAAAEEKALGEGCPLRLRHTIEEGPSAKVLLRESEGADLLVVGSRGLGGFSSLALGSVSSACVHHAHCPVLVIRPAPSEQTDHTTSEGST